LKKTKTNSGKKRVGGGKSALAKAGGGYACAS
jgi:hypothetical protein